MSKSPKQLVFATGNPNKIAEVQELLDGFYQIKGLRDIGCPVDLPETTGTIEGNARQKAQYVVDLYKVDCFSEDTGLEVFALGGQPGVYSGRYAGPEKNELANRQLLLKRMYGIQDRSARFRTVVALIVDRQVHLFEGVIKGSIAETSRGDQGFGYDPLFVPEGDTRTFAEMSSREKNAISHRGQAITKLRDFLRGNGYSPD